MPGLDRTGPNGEGSQTGRKLGKCNPNDRNIENQENESKQDFERGRGRGFGQGFRQGRGRRRGFGHE